MAPQKPGAGEALTASPAPGGRQVWRRLLARRAALAATLVIVLLALVAAAAPLLSALEGQDPTSYHNDLLDSAAGGVPTGSFGGVSADHWLGVEPGTGRDVFARLVHGARISLLVAVGATLVQVTLGVLIGLAAGLGNRLVDQLIGNTTEVMLALPSLVFAISLMAVVPTGFPRPLLLTLVIGLLGWAGTSRVVRAQTLSLRQLDYVSAARLAGASRWRIARRELLPSLAAPVITYAAVLLPSNIIAEAGLSFLGVGVKPPTSSWGQMLSGATTWFRADPMYVLLPSALLFVTVLAFTVLGDAVRTELDPRAASRLRVGTARGTAKDATAGTTADATAGQAAGTDSAAKGNASEQTTAEEATA
ncbi:ABC transporter permease [Streptomyces sp. CBMA156]|uniref:ABC transporter permease n=1 Tax=Streptomyces sp. CBMA156 TaxID=1930280 RepID=UPI001661BC0C|nr:ABC transporter permease [Streptomyces sp. CBMA156]MBD0672210.1 peptide ABC transporter permease [Streptomyces sp. CBMA156]